MTLKCVECGKPLPSGMVRHRACYEESAKASRGGAGPMRYGLLGVSNDILEARMLAIKGGAGPVGPNFERMYWSDGVWTLEPEAPTQLGSKLPERTKDAPQASTGSSTTD